MQGKLPVIWQLSVVQFELGTAIDGVALCRTRFYDDPEKFLSHQAIAIFRSYANKPYAGEDLFSAASPLLNARCMRDAATPGMCLSERRIGGADLTFRFPRSWLSQWREVADAMDRLTVEMHGAH